MTALEGRVVVVTRPAVKAEHLIRLLEEVGAETVHYPTIAIEDPESWDAVDDSVARLAEGEYDWIVFTSVNAVERFLSRAGSPVALGGTQVAAVGTATESALRKRGLFVDVVPQEFTAAAVAGAIGPPGGKVLLPRVEGAPRAVTEAFTERGWTVDEVAAYRNVLNESAGPPPDVFDAVTFASGSAARNFVTLMDRHGIDPFAERGPGANLVVCIGPSTATAAMEVGLPVDAVAPVHTDEGLVNELATLVISRT